MSRTSTLKKKKSNENLYRTKTFLYEKCFYTYKINALIDTYIESRTSSTKEKSIYYSFIIISVWMNVFCVNLCVKHLNCEVLRIYSSEVAHSLLCYIFVIYWQNRNDLITVKHWFNGSRLVARLPTYPHIVQQYEFDFYSKAFQLAFKN